MCDGEVHEGTPDENEGERTPPNAANTVRTAMPPPLGRAQPQLEQLRELERKLKEEQQRLAQLHMALKHRS
jgi:hypothetical protein